MCNTKICKKCNLEKSLNDFYKAKTTKDKHRGICILCMSTNSHYYKPTPRITDEMLNITETTKCCLECGVNKLFCEFTRNQRNKLGLCYKCKGCLNAERKRYVEESGYKQKRTYESIRDYVIRKQYGMTLKDYYKMLENQGNKCKICNKESDKTLHVDHDHITGKVRDLLCNKCNTALGLVNDNTDLLENMIKYLQKHKN